MMRNMKLLIPMLGLLLASGTVIQAQAVDALEVQQQGEVTYISGGVGEEERHQLEALSGQFNLKVVMALAEGNYLSDVDLTIRDSQGNTVINTVSQGPWFYAALPTGEYTIEARIENNQQQRQVSVPTSGLREVTMTW